MTENRRKSFEDYWSDAPSYITLSSGEFYPDILIEACMLYEPVLEMFSRLLKTSESAERLFQEINFFTETWMRIQLLRIFRKYVSPDTPVEMLKKKSSESMIIDNFGSRFRSIAEVQTAFESRPLPDEALCALLWEYKGRGSKGYDFTERLFEMIESRIPEVKINGPRRAGKDIMMGSIFAHYPNQNRPIDFTIEDKADGNLLAVGLARYDGDRGGAQEDDRTGGYASCANELIDFFEQNKMDTKIVFANDGPGLLLGSMWRDYSLLEQRDAGRIMVTTLRMIPERLTYDWLRGLQ